MNLSLIALIYCITSFIKQIQILVDHLYFVQLDKTQRSNKVLSINNKWFHYVVTIELKHEEFGKNSDITFCK